MKIKRIGAFEVDVFKHAVYVYIGIPDNVPINAQAHCSMPAGSQHIELYIRDKKAFQGYVMRRSGIMNINDLIGHIVCADCLDILERIIL